LYASEAGRRFFLGAGCGLCTRRDWSVEAKNWERFTARPSSAPPTAAAPAPSSSPPCLSARTVTVHPRRGVRSALLYVDGRRVGALGRAGRRLRFTGRPATTVVVRIVGRDARGRRVVDVRRYRLCAHRT
jgi:hypothetical protein